MTLKILNTEEKVTRKKYALTAMPTRAGQDFDVVIVKKSNPDTPFQFVVGIAGDGKLVRYGSVMRKAAEEVGIKLNSYGQIELSCEEE